MPEAAPARRVERLNFGAGPPASQPSVTPAQRSGIRETAVFIAAYGGATYCNPGWPTRDHIIPFRFFYALLAELPAAAFPQASAVQHGIRAAFGDEQLKDLIED